MENTEVKKENKITFKKLLAVIIISLVLIITAAVLFLCLRPDDLYTVTEAKYDALGFDAPQTLKYNYDETGRLSSINVDGKNRYLYSYTDDGKTVTIENKADNTKRTIKFNDNFDVIEKVYSDGTNETFTYDRKGKLISSVNTNGVKITYYYDGKNIIAEDYSSGERVEYEYAGKRILSEVVYNVNGKSHFTFYHYNDNKTLAKKDMIYDAINYEYDSKKRVISQTNNSEVSMSFSYDEHGNITSISYPTPATMEYTYEKVDIPESIYKLNKTLITYNDVLTEETVELLR